MTDFFRFPYTPHIDWLGKDFPRDDKVLSPAEVDTLLADEVLVEEKLDGANLGISLDSDGGLKVQNRGQYLTEPFAGQFSRLKSWLDQHQWTLRDNLTSNLIVFGEWCAAKHSLDYNFLPDWWVVFDIYDRRVNRFFSSRRRNELAQTLGLVCVPELFKGRVSLAELKKLLNTAQSRYRSGSPEGLIVRQQNYNWCSQRGKLVKADFIQDIGEHWSKQSIEWNSLK